MGFFKKLWYRHFVDLEVKDDTMEKQINIDNLFDVDDFNKWFNSDNNGSYANPGIFLRLDKLSPSIIFDYFKYNYVTNVESKMYGEYTQKFFTFQEDIRKDWMEKINNNK
jgi:hypothetical protein